MWLTKQISVWVSLYYAVTLIQLSVSLNLIAFLRDCHRNIGQDATESNLLGLYTEYAHENRVYGTETQSDLSEPCNLGTFQNVVWDILRQHGYLVNPLIGKRIQQQQQQAQQQHQSPYQMRLRNPPKH